MASMARKRRSFKLERGNGDIGETYENDGREPEKCHWSKELFPGFYICTDNCIPCIKVNHRDCEYLKEKSHVKIHIDGSIEVKKDNEGK